MQIIKSIFNGLLDIIYPPHCVACGKVDTAWVCSNCLAQITYLEPPFCARCGIPCTSGICTECRNRSFTFRSANSAVEFRQPVVEVVHKFKYGGHMVLADQLSQLMVDRFHKTNLQGKCDLVVAVPEHSSRLIERGFNQAEELAYRLAGAIGVDYEKNALKKIRRTSPQVGLQANQRITNLSGAFKVLPKTNLYRRSVLIVDDVMTTGSTLEEVAKELKNAGAASVRAYTLARSI